MLNKEMKVEMRGAPNERAICPKLLTMVKPQPNPAAIIAANNLGMTKVNTSAEFRFW
jgi:hypothetical protein